ncbi:hypothetical protein BDU57DRAFT_525100 [Ampelomyces quisqualis]|uniref:Uncharacterized protein n=1 Tax=Ampelomyces quisqualis TaxID=50730 RepID=A0A6A5Q892_AMPQU|nr:hypothetical protein BDU57DRAFT_525100 [Ampelomyces quisqualis]
MPAMVGRKRREKGRRSTTVQRIEAETSDEEVMMETTSGRGRGRGGARGRGGTRAHRIEAGSPPESDEEMGTLSGRGRGRERGRGGAGGIRSQVTTPRPRPSRSVARGSGKKSTANHSSEEYQGDEDEDERGGESEDENTAHGEVVAGDGAGGVGDGASGGWLARINAARMALRDVINETLGIPRLAAAGPVARRPKRMRDRGDEGDEGDDGPRAKRPKGE